MMRKFLPDPRLKVTQIEKGTLSHTNVAIMYLEEYVDPHLLQSVQDKIKKLDIENLIDGAQLMKAISEQPRSIFPQVYETERLDIVSFSLSQGKIVVFVDNSTFASILPITLFNLIEICADNFQIPWDLTFIRLLRFFTMIVATLLPALYVSLVGFHPELLPTTLALTIAETRNNIPFPVATEALLMIFALDILVEASIRLPSNVGQTIGYFRAEQKVARSKDIKVFEYRRDREITSHSAIIPLAKSEGNTVIIEDMAVMQNYKMVDILTEHEVGTTILLKENKIEGMNYILNVPYENEEIPVSLTRIDLKAEVNHVEKKPVEFDIHIEGTGEITEVLNGYTNRDFITKIEKAFNEQFEKEIRNTIERIQAANVDPWLLGHRVMIKDKGFFDTLNWEENGLRNSKFSINVDLSIDLIGQRGVFSKKKLEDTK